MIDQRGLQLVYLSAFRATPLSGAQLPSCVVEPTNLIFSPQTVVARRSNITATAVGVVHGVLVVVVVGPPDLVLIAGHVEIVTLLYVPETKVAIHTKGTLVVDCLPQPAGITALRRLFAVNSAV